MKLGLNVSQASQAVPTLSRLHLSAAQPGAVSELVHSWQEAGIITKEGGREIIKGENDTFHLESQEREKFDMSDVKNAISTADSTDGTIDYNTIPKRLLPHESSLPTSKETPRFDHSAFFSALTHHHSTQRETHSTFGQNLLYGEIVTSTSTLLDKNPTFLAQLPNGFTATATTQVAGRGRGTNVWISPPGSLMFSTVLRHSLALTSTAPVVFVQYLAAIAVVKGIHGYDKGWEKLPVRLKWPNDVYALDPARPESEKAYVKIGGILVNSSYAGGDYTLVTGIGMNTLNTSPTTSLCHLARKASLPAPSIEKLLASILAHFEGLYTRFCRTGFDKVFEEMYYKLWLHTDQIVTLEVEGGARARLKGITTDWGLLVAEELGWEDRATGKRWELQSDSNSFDFFRGLVKRKV
jgi:biotin--protein ligase